MLRGSDRKISFGILVTVVWLCAAAIYAMAGWSSIVALKPNEVGDTLAGTFAPLAFLWLVLGYFQQGEELSMQREELALQRHETARLANEANRQATAIEQTAIANRRDLFMKLLAVMERQQCDLARRIFDGVHGYTPYKLKELSSEEPTVILSTLLEDFVDAEEREIEIPGRSSVTLRGDAVRIAHLSQKQRGVRVATLEFRSRDVPECRVYQRNTQTLLDEARQADETGALERFMENSPMMRIHRVICRWQDESLALPDQETIEF